jgi:hypothetical protein
MRQRSPKDLIFRPICEIDTELLQRARQSIAEAKAASALPVPSTFLGRCGNPTHDEIDTQK